VCLPQIAGIFSRFGGEAPAGPGNTGIKEDSLVTKTEGRKLRDTVLLTTANLKKATKTKQHVAKIL
jgi:hypothetical protein